MLFGMTRGEMGLVIFIFAMVYAVRLIPPVGDWIGRLLGDRSGDKESGA
jgi:hypothetical protein